MFENSAIAIFELSANLKTVDAVKKLEIKLENDKIDNLLYDFLSEILFLKDSKYMVFKKVKVNIVENRTHENQRFSGPRKSKGFSREYELKAILEGDAINPEKQQLENDIKAVTMHMFKVKKEKNNWKATVVVDI